MRHSLIVAPAFAAAALMSTSALALDAVAVTDLNMRAGPGPQYPIVTTIANSDNVEVLGCTESTLWCDVSYDGVRGWAYADYLASSASGQQIALPQAVAAAEMPRATYDAGAYWEQNYRDRPFYAEREQYVSETGSTGAASGAAGGAITGALIGGPVGAAVGGIAGAAIGATLDPPERVGQYVVEKPADRVLLDGEVVVGAGVPDTVTLAEVPDYDYRYAYVNGQPVLVDPQTRRIVYVYR